MPRTPALPKCQVSDLQFALLGLLLPGREFQRNLVRKLREEFGWNPGSGKMAEYHALHRFESQGLIHSETLQGGERAYRLTDRGLERWKEAYDHHAACAEFWAEARRKKHAKPARIDGVSSYKSSKKLAPAQRFPTPVETAEILRRSPPAFRQIVEFALLAKVRPSDLLNSRIEGIDRSKRFLQLEAKSASGRSIENRRVPLDGPALRILTEAIQGRKGGPIFLTKSGREWTLESFSATFRRIRQTCGLPGDVVLSGRGGRIGGEIEASRSEAPHGG